MMFSLLSSLFVILIAAYSAFQGLFSVAIFFIEALTSLMVAFGYYESLNSLWAGQLPEYGAPLALMVLFLATLALLRVGTDMYIRGNMQFPLAVDRAGGAILGLLTGMTITGTVLIAIQMLPLGPNVLGFQRYDPAAPTVRRSVMLNSDGFVIGLVNLLSAGRFEGETRFERAHTDLLDDLYAVNNGFQVESRRQVPGDSLTVKKYWDAPALEHVEQQPATGGIKRSFQPAPPEDPSKKILVVRVGLSNSAADSGEGEQAMVRFTPTQFRVVGPRPDPNGGGRAPANYSAVGLSDLYVEKTGAEVTPAQRDAHLVRWPSNARFGLTDANAGKLKENGVFVFDVAFEVPQDFTPWYVAFKSGARAELTQSQALKAPPARSVAAPARETRKKTGTTDEDEDEDEDKPTKSKPKSKPGKKAGKNSSQVKVGPGSAGRTNVATAVEERTGISDELPIVLKRSAVPDSMLKGGKFEEGQIVVDSPPTDVAESEAIRKFDVPSEYRMVQVGFTKEFAGSLYGQALEFAKRTLSQIFVTAESGEQYFAIGVYTCAVVNGKQVFEMQYWPTALEEQPERALKEPKRLTPMVLRMAGNRDELKMGFLFLVKPGEHIIKFNTSPRSGAQNVSIEVPG